MNTNHYTIRLETPADYCEVENLTREAFWNVYRPGCLEHYVLHKFRNNSEFVPELDFVMEKDSKIIGHVMFVRAKIQTDGGIELPIMTFGPFSIATEYQRKGYGKVLLNYALEQAAKMGVGAICMEGNIDFYGKCGFVIASTKRIHYYAEPKDAQVPYFLLKELKNGFLDEISGTYHTPKGYFVDEKEAEIFDKQFPRKEKLKLPSQLV